MRKRIALVWLSTAVFFFAALPAEVAPSAKEIRPLLPGTQIPDVRFVDLENRSVALSELVAEKPAVLIFYRGGW